MGHLVHKMGFVETAVLFTVHAKRMLILDTRVCFHNLTDHSMYVHIFKLYFCTHRGVGSCSKRGAQFTLKPKKVGVQNQLFSFLRQKKWVRTLHIRLQRPCSQKFSSITDRISYVLWLECWRLQYDLVTYRGTIPQKIICI